MITYINKNVPGYYITLENKLNRALHNNVGSIYEHYLNGWFIELSEEQVKFHEDNPDASVEEVINMELKEKILPDPLIEAKNKKLNMILSYDQSKHVNGFIVNDVITTWLTVLERLNYKQSVESAKLLGENTLDFLIEGMPFSVSIEQAEYMLAMILRYADKCFIITAQHKANVNALTSIEEVEAYNYKQGYPEMLKFDLV